MPFFNLATEIQIGIQNRYKPRTNINGYLVHRKVRETTGNNFPKIMEFCFISLNPTKHISLPQPKYNRNIVSVMLACTEFDVKIEINLGGKYR